jgi:hypothetical protein
VKWQIPEKNNLKEKGFILAQVSEVSVHGQLAPLLWAQQAHVAEKAAHLMASGKQKKWQEGAGDKNIFLGLNPSDLPPHLPQFHHLPIVY